MRKCLSTCDTKTMRFEKFDEIWRTFLSPGRQRLSTIMNSNKSSRWFFFVLKTSVFRERILIRHACPHFGIMPSTIDRPSVRQKRFSVRHWKREKRFFLVRNKNYSIHNSFESKSSPAFLLWCWGMGRSNIARIWFHRQLHSDVSIYFFFSLNIVIVILLGPTSTSNRNKYLTFFVKLKWKRIRYAADDRCATIPKIEKNTWYRWETRLEIGVQQSDGNTLERLVGVRLE